LQLSKAKRNNDCDAITVRCAWVKPKSSSGSGFATCSRFRGQPGPTENRSNAQHVDHAVGIVGGPPPICDP
jgi:hypothetical protein